MKNKVIILDMGIFTHRTWFASQAGNIMSEKYTCMMMILSCLKRIGVTKEDWIICACEGGHNWRKDYSVEYKSDRQIIPQIFWDKMNDLLDDIEIATNWCVVKIPRIEADDIMAVACRYYYPTPVILVTYDHDLEQMFHYSNVKIFSPHPKSKKYKIKPDNYNAYNQISKQIYKEVGDGLKSIIQTDADLKTRKMLVNLLELPDFVEEAVKRELNKLKFNTKIRPELLPGKKLPQVFEDIYKLDKVITYEEQVAKLKIKKERKYKKKKKIKYKKERKEKC